MYGSIYIWIQECQLGLDLGWNYATQAWWLCACEKYFHEPFWGIWDCEKVEKQRSAVLTDVEVFGEDLQRKRLKFTLQVYIFWDCKMFTNVDMKMTWFSRDKVVLSPTYQICLWLGIECFVLSVWIHFERLSKNDNYECGSR